MNPATPSTASTTSSPATVVRALPATGLRAHGLGVAFSGLRVLHGVDLRVGPGEVVGLIGPNGAGKTTLINALSGFVAPSAGTVLLDGQAMTGTSAEDFRRAGVARTFQGGRLFRALSVRDNLEAAAVGLGARRASARAQAEAVLDELDLAGLAERPAGALPYTDERRVAIARALIGEPRHLLLDEPAAGMGAHEADGLCRLIEHIAARRGCGVLLVEHNVRLVLSVCRHIVVLDAGEVIEAGAPADIAASERVREAYMGRAEATS